MANPPLSDNGGYLTTPDPSERPPNRRSSERRQLDGALRECEERYQALFASVDCVYLLDFEGRFLEANPAALELLGYEHEEILALSLSSLLDDAQTARAFGVIAEVRETGRQATPIEFRLRRRTGEYVNVETKASVVLRDGQPYAVLGVGRDITERMKAEQALRESERRLVEAQHLGKFGNWE
ncbi:MAG TPA: PAS domain S-box protein, partial [Thermoleophilia bacterium]